MKQILTSIIFGILSLNILFAQETNIPDSNFEKALIELGIDSDNTINGKVLTNDIKSVTQLIIINKNIDSLIGINEFEDLKILNCSNNNLTKLDIYNNLKLEELNCSSNSLGSINIDSNLSLEKLVCQKNLLSTINVSKNTNLKTFDFTSNQINTIDLDKNDLLVSLKCSKNKLTQLSLKTNTHLEELNCADNRLSSLDVSFNTALKFLLCSSNQLTAITTNAELDEDLTILDCSNNQLTSLEVSQFEKLNNLSCSKNQLTALNLTENDTLTMLDASNNKLTNLDINANTYLETLTCSFNQLTELDLSVNDSLTTINVRNNLLTSIDLRENEALTSINVSSNNLKSLNIKNGNNANVSIFDAHNNPNLHCIAVDDDVLPNGGTDWLKDDFTYYNTDCGNIIYTYVPENSFEAYLETHDINGNPVALGATNSLGDGIADNNFVLTSAIEVVVNLNIGSLGITDLTGIEDFTALEILECSGNNLDQMDLSSNTELTTLICSGNGLTDLDVSFLTWLTKLDCSGNNLEQLDSSNNALLFDMDCSENSLEELDLSLNTALSILNCSGNELEQLDLSTNLVLSSIDCSANALYTLNIKNGNNADILSFIAIDNNLLCINVDNSTEANAASNWEKDPDTEYNEACGFTYVPDDNFEAYLETHDINGNLVDISDDSNLGDGAMNNFVLDSKISIADTLIISGLSIAKLKGIANFTALEYLDCSNNNLAHLDVSSNTLLKQFKCQFNEIEALDTSNNPVLDTLVCNNNVLTKLNIKNGQNGILTVFDASSNPNLYCIMVDNVGDANAASGWIKDAIAEYSLDCSLRETEIPDPNFEQALIDLGYDIGIPNGSVPTSNIEGILDLDISDKTIKILEGIEDFRSLDSLKVYGNLLTNLDVSQNVNLVKLNCGDNQITDFNNLSLNTGLEELICDSNYFTGIDISLNTALKKLDISSNNISSIDLSTNVNLTELYCGNNFLNELDLSENSQLTKLNCADNYIATLDLMPNTALKILDCSNNDLEMLNISNNTNIAGINCDSNLITELVFNPNVSYSAFDALSCNNNVLEDLDVSHFTGLTSLSCSSNQLDILDVSSNTLLLTLNISNNYFESVNLTNNVALNWLDCSNNALSGLELDSNILLEVLHGDNNQLTSIDIGVNSNILKLSFTSNALDTLDLTNYTTLLDINIRDNLLTEFSTDNLTNLKNFNCSSNEITALDLSNNSDLENLNCSDNALWSLNIKNGNNGILEFMNATNNPELLCIQIDNKDNQDWQKDANASYSDNCHYFETHVPDDAFEQELINLGYDVGALNDYVLTDNIRAVVNLDLNNLTISDLSGIEDFIALKVLNISDNQIDSLNIGNTINLIELYASNNLLDSLDLSNNSAIEIIDISNNQLSELITDNLSSLSSLNCSANPLVDLDVSSNSELESLNCSTNQLYTLNIRNGNNSILAELNALDNPDLTCIQADFESPPDGVNWQIDDIASYSINCHFYETYVPDDAFETALDPNGELDNYVSTSLLTIRENLDINSLGITDLTGLEAIINLKTLSCQNNNINSMDLSNNLFLENLYCNNNNIENIDVSFLNDLKKLNISENNLTVIDVNQNHTITSLNVSKNAITSLDLVSNINLTVLDCSSNLLSSLLINNGFNENITAFDSRDNPYLYCILVDDQNATINYSNWQKDAQASYKLICDDDDNDGVPNIDDQCLNTPFGNAVDLFGCSLFTLPTTNFNIITTSETCSSSNNGIVTITAIEAYNYTATIIGEGINKSYKFTNSVDIKNLRSGTYQLCLTIDDRPNYMLCYDVIIIEPEELVVSSKISTTNNKVSLNLSGGNNYTIDFNGVIINTTNSIVKLNLIKGINTISVKTDLDCQGKYNETIFYSNDVIVYPNPFDNQITISMGSDSSKEIIVKINNSFGQLILQKNYSTINGNIAMDTSQLSVGIYFISLISDNSQSTFKIVKK